MTRVEASLGFSIVVELDAPSPRASAAVDPVPAIVAAIDKSALEGPVTGIFRASRLACARERSSSGPLRCFVFFLLAEMFSVGDRSNKFKLMALPNVRIDSHTPIDIGVILHQDKDFPKLSRRGDQRRQAGIARLSRPIVAPVDRIAAAASGAPRAEAGRLIKAGPQSFCDGELMIGAIDLVEMCHAGKRRACNFYVLTGLEAVVFDELFCWTLKACSTLVKMALEAQKGVADRRHAAKSVLRVADCPVF